MEHAEPRLRLAVLRGQYDLLFHIPQQKSSRKPRELRATGIKALQCVYGWVTADGRSVVRQLEVWPPDAAQLDELKLCYSRSGLLLEACIERPKINGIVDTDLLPSLETSRKLFAAFPERLAELLQDRTVSIDVVSETLDAAKFIAVVHILRIMQSYTIFDTEKSVLIDLEALLKATNKILTDVQRALRSNRQERSSANSTVDTEKKRWASLTEMHGVNGLLQYSLARVYRAQGGPHLETARQCLVRALVHYEDRTARESSIYEGMDREEDGAIATWDGRNTQSNREERKEQTREKREQRRGHIISSSYRSSLVLAQQSYLAFIESKLADGDSAIKAARLLALVSGDNEVLLSEIELISLCIARSLLKPSKILNDDQEESSRRAQILKGLRDVESLSVAYDRLAYANMSLYQRAQCRSYRSNRLSKALQDADRILENCQVMTNDPKVQANAVPHKASKLSSIYWQVSANTLKVTLTSRAARYEKDFNLDRLRNALMYGELALRLSGNRAEIKHLRVDCCARMAEAYVLLGETKNAERHLSEAIPESTNAGYTTQPFITGLGTLLEAEIALQREDFQRAVGLITKFEQSSLPHVESEWLRDHYQHVLKRMIDTRGVLMITASMLRADQENKPADRKLKYTDLKERLQEFMYDATWTTKMSDKDLAAKLGVNPKTAAQFRMVIQKRREGA